MAEVFQLVIEIDGRKVPAQARRVSQGMGSIESSARKATRMVGLLAASFAGLALGKVVRDVVRVSAEFEQLRAQLKTVTGSAEAAARAFGGIQKFATETPFSLQEVTKAFIGLKARGFAPTEEAMRSIGNLAASFGKPIETAMQAVTQAAFGEAEMLKQFGIIMRQQGDQVRITFDGVTKTIKKDAGEIFNALLEISNQNFGSGMADQMNTFNGAVSNLGDAWDQLLDTVGNGTGVMQTVLTRAIRIITAGVGHVTTGIKNLGAVWRLVLADIAEAMGKFWLKVRPFFDLIPGFGASLEDIDRVVSGALLEGVRLTAEALKIMHDNAVGGFEAIKTGAAGGGAALGVTAEQAEALVQKFRDLKEQAGIAAGGLLLEVREIEITDHSIENMKNTLKEAARDGTSEGVRGGLSDISSSPGLGFKNDFKKNMEGFGARLGQSAVDAIINSDLDKFFDNLGRIVAANIAGALMDASVSGLENKGYSALASNAVVAFAALFVAGAISVFDQLSDRGVTSGFRAEVASFSGAVSIFTNSIMTFRDAAILVAEAQRSVNAKLNDLFGGIGGFMFSPGSQEFSGFGNGGGPGGGQAGGGNDDDAIAFADRLKIPLFNILDGLSDFFIWIEEKGGEWVASIRGIASGWGETVEAAIEDLMNTFVQRLPALIEQGLIILAHVPDALVEVLKNSGAQTFDQLKEALEVATRVFMQSLGPIEADLFAFFNKLATDIQEAIRVGLPKDVARDAIRNQIQGFISQVAGVDLFPKFANVEAIMEQFRMQLERLGITGKEQVKLLKQMELATDLYNRSLEVDVLGQLADMARQFGLAAEFVREVEIARVRIQFAILKAQLISLELWKKFKDIWKLVRDHALDAARSMDSAARSASGIGRSLGGGGGAAVPTVRVSGTVPVDVVSESFQNEDRLATFRTALRSFMGRFADAARDPVQQLLLDFQDVIDKIERIRQDSRRDIAMAEATRAFQQALTMILEGLKSELQKFRDSLESTILGGGTRRERAMNALGSFQDLLTRAMGGDLSAFQQLQEAADLALRLGQEAFGTSTDDFRAIFDIVTGGLDQILGMDFMDLFGNVDPFGESDSLSALQSSVDLQTSALIAELEESRRDQANRMNAQTQVLEQINARLAGSSSGPPI